MAETNGTSPPVFREPLVSRNTLVMTDTWQRWLSAFWQQASSGTPGPAGPQGPVGPQGPQGPAGPALGSGAANKVGTWLNASTMTYDSLLHYDPAQHWLGIGTATPTAPLTFSNALGPKIDIWYSAGGGRYGMGLANGQMQLYADPSGFVHLGNMGADGTTFTSRLYVGTSAYASVPMGVVWPIQANYELTTNRLYAAGVSSFGGAMGIGVAPGAYTLDVNGTFHVYSFGRIEGQLVAVGGVDAYSYSMMASLRLGDHVPPGAILDVNGTAFFRGNTIVSPGYLQVPDNALYTAGAHGIIAQGHAEVPGSYAVSRWIKSDPNWGGNVVYAELFHLYSNYVSLTLGATAGGANSYAFHMSNASAFITMGSWVDAPSDRRIKRNIQPIDTPLERLAKLHGSHYERTDLQAVAGFPAPNPHEYGLIAQDVAEALPDAAFEHDYGGTQGKLWNYYDRPILALLVESVKVLAQRVEALEGV